MDFILVMLISVKLDIVIPYSVEHIKSEKLCEQIKKDVSRQFKSRDIIFAKCYRNEF